MSKINPHYIILKSLYELYNENKYNESITDKISSIGWALEHDLGFDDYGYFELSELINYGDKEDTDGYYINEIETSLKKLKDTNEK